MTQEPVPACLCGDPAGMGQAGSVHIEGAQVGDCGAAVFNSGEREETGTEVSVRTAHGPRRAVYCLVSRDSFGWVGLGVSR